MTREDAHFKLRLPEDLRANLKSSAALNRRSLTAEIIQRLYQSLEDERIAYAAGVATSQKNAREIVGREGVPNVANEAEFRARLNKLSIDEVNDVLRAFEFAKTFLESAKD